MSESEVTDLPDPDSPTTQTVSPGSIANETSFDPDDGSAIGLELDAQIVDRDHRLPGVVTAMREEARAVDGI